MNLDLGLISAKQASNVTALRERAEMLVRVSEQTGLPLDNSGPPELGRAIAEVQRVGLRSS